MSSLPLVSALTPEDQFDSSLTKALTLFEQLRDLRSSLLQVATMVTDTLLAGGKLMIAGNGGSASDSAHLATEFTCRFRHDRRPYPAMALPVDGGLMTAIGNDYHFEQIFERQVIAFGKKGDLLLALSTSGNSRNLLLALQAARERGIQTVALLGQAGGFTKGVAHLEIIVPGEQTARIQEAQKFLLHVLCEIVEERLPRTF